MADSENEVHPVTAEENTRESEPRFVDVHGSAELTEDDFRAVFFALPHVKRLMFSFIYLVFGLSLVGWSGVFEARHRYPIALSIALLGLTLVVSGANRARTQWVRQMWSEFGAKGHMVFEFDQVGFSARIGFREWQFDWADALMMVESKTAFVIYTDPRSFLVVPIRAFEHYKVPDLRLLLAEHVPRGSELTALAWRKTVAKSLLLLAAIWVLAQLVGL